MTEVNRIKTDLFQERNILMIIDSLGIGGAERCVQLLSSEMAAKGHRVVVLVIRDNVDMELDNGVIIEVLGFVRFKASPKYIINAVRLRKKLSELESKYGKFDLKIANLTLSMRLLNYARVSNFYFCIHSNFSVSNIVERKGVSSMLRKRKITNLLKNRDVIAVSEGIKDDLISNFNIKFKSIRTIYNPIDTKLVQTLSKQDNPYIGIKYIVHVGRMSTEKRHDVLLEAYKLSGIQHKLVLVGDGPKKQSIIDKIRELELIDKVILAGFLKNPYPVINGADLLVLSSDYEGFGIVLTEALALHKLVVSTDCKSGPREIMSPRFTDYLAPVGNVIVLSQKIKQALDDVYNEKITIDDAAIERFAVNRIAKQYLSLR